MTTFIPVNFDAVQEPKPVPRGNYDLQITQAEVALSGENSKRPGSPQYKVSIAIDGPEGEHAPNITHFISLPHEEDEPSSAQFKALLLKRFLTLFNIPFDSQGIDLEKTAMEMVGRTARAEVSLSDPDDNGNVYNRLVVPRIREEDTGGRRR